MLALRLSETGQERSFLILRATVLVDQTICPGMRPPLSPVTGSIGSKNSLNFGSQRLAQKPVLIQFEMDSIDIA
jgi:hypothetical protein